MTFRGAGKIFRPHRDVRFSADKSPYRTHIAAVLDGGGYVQLSADGLAAGRGMWHLETEHLARYRASVDDDAAGEELVRIVDDLAGKGIGIVAHASLETVPRGFDRDHARADLLRRKGLAAWQDWPVGAWLGTARARDRIERFLAAASPLNDWLQRHVG